MDFIERTNLQKRQYVLMSEKIHEYINEKILNYIIREILTKIGEIKFRKICLKMIKMFS